MRPDPAPSPIQGAAGDPGRRRRRLTLLAALAPGPVLIVAAVNVWANPWLLAGGLVWCAGVLAVLRTRAVMRDQAFSPASPLAPETKP